MWLTQLVDRNRQCHAGRVALVDDRGCTTWGRLAQRVDNLAGGLTDWGVRPGDRVAVLSTDRREVVESYLALGRLGALFVPLNHGLVPREVAEIAAHARLSAIVGERHLLERMAGSGPHARLPFEDPAYAAMAERERTRPLPDVQADDLAAILHTSATAGWPKGAVSDHRALKAIALGWLAAAGPADRAVLVSTCPLYHGSVVLSLAYLAAGATLVLVADPTPQRVLAALREHAATHVWLVPELLRDLVEAGLDRLPDLREILYGAAPMPVELYAAAARPHRGDHGGSPAAAPAGGRPRHRGGQPGRGHDRRRRGRVPAGQPDDPAPAGRVPARPGGAAPGDGRRPAAQRGPGAGGRGPAQAAGGHRRRTEPLRRRRVALAGSAARFAAVGVDLEISTLPAEAAHLVLMGPERDWLALAPSREAAERALIAAFCAKEAAFKAFAQLERCRLDRLRQVRLAPRGRGFACWPEHDPDTAVHVTVGRAGAATFAWTVLSTTVLSTTVLSTTVLSTTVLSTTVLSTRGTLR